MQQYHRKNRRGAIQKDFPSPPRVRSTQQGERGGGEGDKIKGINQSPATYSGNGMYLL